MCRWKSIHHPFIKTKPSSNRISIGHENMNFQGKEVSHITCHRTDTYNKWFSEWQQWCVVPLLYSHGIPFYFSLPHHLEDLLFGRDPCWGILDLWVNNNLQRFLSISIRTHNCMKIWLFNLTGKLLHAKLHPTASKCKPCITPDLRRGVAQSCAAQPCLSSHGISLQKDSPPPTTCRAGLVPTSPIHPRTNALCE